MSDQITLPRELVFRAVKALTPMAYDTWPRERNEVVKALRTALAAPPPGAAAMSPEFDDWWKSDYLPPNPYPKDSPVFWAWAGWQMAVKAEREACARVCEDEGSVDDLPEHYAAAIRSRGEVKP